MATRYRTNAQWFAGMLSYQQKGNLESCNMRSIVPTFQPVRGSPESLDQRVVAAIRDQVEQGQLRTGDRLPPERDMALQFGVSRTALREALHTLAAMGFVELRHGRGVFVTGSSAAATAQRLSAALGATDELARLHELFEIRRVLEGSAAAWAAERAPAAPLAELQATLAAAQTVAAASPLDFAAAGQLDARFHAQIAACAQNRTLTMLMGTMLTELGVARGHSLRIPGRAVRSVTQHAEIAAAIAAHSADQARQAMLHHLDDVEAEIRREEQGE